MNQKAPIFTALLILLASNVSSAQSEIADDAEFIEILRNHGEHNTLREFADEFRKKIELDSDGSLVKEISRNPNLNSTIFRHVDAVPNKYVELVLANWLDDETKWGSKGGFYYSPSSRIEYWIRLYISPQDSNDLKSNSALRFVLENGDIRKALAEVLWACYYDGELDSDKRSERRSEAWAKIVSIVEESFPVLLEDDKKRRDEAAGEPDAEPAEFLKKLRQESSDGVTTNHSSRQPNTETYRWIWLLIALVAILGVLGFSFRDQIIRSITRRRS